MSVFEKFKTDINEFLESNDMSATAFGKRAVSDPNLVFQLRNGRMPSLRLVDRVYRYMNKVSD